MLVAVRYAPSKPQPPICPPPSPPFHQISLPALPVPPRKLQAVRFWTDTPSALYTMIPLRPSWPPLPSEGPKFSSAAFELHCGEPGLVPSTTTVFRFIPRRVTLGVAISTAAGVSDASVGALELVVL
ncbi:MAG: hypothetical protein WB761_29385 [Solirubrobacteraceae bacterium]